MKVNKGKTMAGRCIAIVVLLFLVMTTAGAQESITAQVFAEVIEALAANEDEALNFGRFSPGNNGGAILVYPGGLRTVQGTVVTANGDYSPGRFMVSGAPGASLSIRLPENPAVLIHRKSGKTMQVKDWISDPPSGGATDALPDGACLVSIGATLVIGNIDDNPVGLYAGTYMLTFAYN